MEKEYFVPFLILVFFLPLIFFLIFSSSCEPKIITKYLTFNTSNFTYNQVEIKIPAISSMNGEEKGVITRLKVQVIPGQGRTLTNIENLLFWIDTQYSIRTAKKVAERIVGINTSKLDFIYTIETNASIIEGPSAGAALTVATIAALEGKPINQSVVITGTINEDGSIGRVGGILEKGKAAKEANATLFLVPKGQSKIVEYVPETKCKKFRVLTICETKYKKKSVDVSKEIGIEVKEVETIEEALNYFFS